MTRPKGIAEQIMKETTVQIDGMARALEQKGNTVGVAADARGRGSLDVRLDLDRGRQRAVVEAREDERVRGGVIRSEAMQSKLQKERSDENTFGNRWL